ncbi:S8 family serine peptidase [Dactylosporangium siamense]|uniref:Serine protease n=1 Tax=Dactylosporangium siamense TaxID=685454 RepID=A0A919PWP6_9ACTN|nr:S8 family peptidase [Dactylosporangium siamense]GIG51679.1 serine protease [Dactylosporangium siamense]
MRSTLRATFVAAAAAAGLVAAGSPALAAPAEGQIRDAGKPGAIRDRYIVVLKDTVSASDTASSASRLADRFGGQVRRSFGSTLKGFSAQLTERGAKRLAANPLVDYVQQDRTVALAASQTGAPWGLDRIDQASRPLDGTYTYQGTGANVTAYVVDTGVRLTHSEFGGRARSGYDFVDNDTDASDCHGHGTHVAGTIGGSTYGVAKSVNIVSVRVLDCEGSGSYSGIIAGIDWVTANAQKPAVVNMSLGGSASPALDQAVRNSIASGVTYAIAAGNENVDACNISPARTPEAITVGATDVNDNRASFSNYGNCVDVFAPGVAITSASNSGDAGSAIMSGTSMASPHVAGAAALYLSAYPSATPAQVQSALLSTAVPNVVGNPGAGSPNRLLSTAAMTATVPASQPASQPVAVVATPVPAATPCNVRTNAADATIRDRGTVTTSVVVSGCAGKASSKARVEVHVVHAKRGDLVVELIAPNGSVKRLKAASTKDKAKNLDAAYTVNLSSRLKNGTWKLRVRDSYKGNTGYLDSWTLTV